MIYGWTLFPTFKKKSILRYCWAPEQMESLLTYCQQDKKYWEIHAVGEISGCTWAAHFTYRMVWSFDDISLRVTISMFVSSSWSRNLQSKLLTSYNWNFQRNQNPKWYRKWRAVLENGQLFMATCHFKYYFETLQHREQTFGRRIFRLIIRWGIWPLSIQVMFKNISRNWKPDAALKKYISWNIQNIQFVGQNISLTVVILNFVSEKYGKKGRQKGSFCFHVDSELVFGQWITKTWPIALSA